MPCGRLKCPPVCSLRLPQGGTRAQTTSLWWEGPVVGLRRRETVDGSRRGARCGRRAADNQRADNVVKAPPVRTPGFAGSPAVARKRARAPLHMSSCGRKMRKVIEDVTNLL